MAAVLIVDIWKTTPFMALLILAGLQMLPGDIYEAAKIDGVHPIKVFWKVTLPLIRPALMVAVIFRGLDALRIFDLIYVLTPNNVQTTSMSVYARENLFDFDKFAYGSAASTFLFLVILAHHHRLHQGSAASISREAADAQAGQMGGSSTCSSPSSSSSPSFPFYYAIITTFKSGTALFQVDYWPKDFSLTNYVNGLHRGALRAQPPQLAVHLDLGGAHLAPPRRHRRLRAVARPLPRPLAAALHHPVGLDVPADRGARRPLRADPLRSGLYNTPFALIFSYMIFTLPFTVWVLTTFVRDLPIEIEEAAIVDGATPWMIISKVFLPLMWPALVTTGLLAFIGAWNEFLFALTFISNNDQRTVPVAIALLSGSDRVRDPVGQHHGRLGDRHRAARHSRPDLPAQDHLRPDRRRRQRVSA